MCESMREKLKSDMFQMDLALIPNVRSDSFKIVLKHEGAEAFILCFCFHFSAFLFSVFFLTKQERYGAISKLACRQLLFRS